MSEVSSSASELERERVRQLSGSELEDELFYRLWYVQQDDLIGGVCIMPTDEPPSMGWPEIANFLSQKCAEHIVALHNSWYQEFQGAGFSEPVA
jgi:hypothetical protein